VIASALAVLAIPSAAVAAECPNEAFRTGYGSLLPDCRAYERASPADKNGGAVEGFPNLLAASRDGSSVSFYTQAGTGIPGPGGAPADFSTYLATKVGEEWSTQRLMPPASLGEEAHYLGETRDQHLAFVEAIRTGSGGGHGLFAIDTRTGTVQTIVPTGADEYAAYAVDGSSVDGSRVFFEVEASLTDDAPLFADNLYMWTRATGAITLAGVVPSGEPQGGSFGGPYEWFFNQYNYVGGAYWGMAVEALNAISPDGDQIYFTTEGNDHLYLRRGLAGSNPETADVSAPNAGVEDPNGEKPAAFQEATPDGRFAFFLSSGRLTADANTGPSDEGTDLYRWDAATGALTDIAPDQTDELGAQVKGLLGTSHDGQSGYFAALGSLAPGATDGALNLYRFSSADSGTEIEFIATLSSEGPDRYNWTPKAWEGSAPIPTEAMVQRSSRVSDDGKTLIFSSTRPLTGYDNRGPEGLDCKEGRCREIFRYTAPAGTSQSGVLDCLSCDANGTAPIGSAHLQSEAVANSSLAPLGNSPVVNFPANLSADGDRVFFETPDPLLAADTNAASGCPNYNETYKSRPSCQDVYEWEAAGTPGGSCVSPERAGGCLYLLSTGKSAEPSFFAGASVDGQVAYIVTSSQLVPGDTDDARDDYAVRIGGGIASQFATPSGSCSGEDCLAPPSGSPGLPPVGSVAVEGPSNLRHRHRKKVPRHRHHRRKHKKAGRARAGHSRSSNRRTDARPQLTKEH
jgi:hypothetical protein